MGPTPGHKNKITFFDFIDSKKLVDLFVIGITIYINWPQVCLELNKASDHRFLGKKSQIMDDVG